MSGKNLSMKIFEQYSIPALIFKYSIPTILSQVITVLYNLADTFFIGHTNDPSQIAALTLSFPFFMSTVLIGNLFGIGANSFISRSLGKGDEAAARRASVFSIWGGLLLTLLWIVILFIFLPYMLPIVGAVTPETFNAARSYLTWTLIIGGLPTVAALLLAHSIRGEGNTKLAGIGIMLGGILNIGLDPIFVQGLNMGAAGAGIATCISNCVSLCYMLIMVIRSKHSIVTLNPKRFVADKAMMKEVILVGLPAAAIILLGSTANIIMTHSMSVYGDASVAGFGVVQKIGTVTIQTTVGLTQGIMPLLGFCYGAKDNKRVHDICRWAFIILAIFACVCVLIVEAVPTQLILLFTQEEATVSAGSEFLRFWILCAFGMCFCYLFNCIFQSMGKWKESLLLSLIRQGIVFIPLMLILNHFFGAIGLIVSQPVADTTALIVGCLIYRHLTRHSD